MIALAAAATPAAAQCLDWSPNFQALATQIDGSIMCATVFDDGTGPALFVGGTFTHAGGLVANHIAKWNGSSYSALGTGMTGPSSQVDALTVFDDGTGPALYAAGLFETAGGVATSAIARWNGSHWSALGAGLTAAGAGYALAVFDDGTGPALFVGGGFTTAGGVSAQDVAKWNGSSWSALGPGVSSSLYTLCVFDDGHGAALYAGGLFSLAGGINVSHVARWDGSTWSAVAGGANGIVYSSTVFDDGTGPALYLGGLFSAAGGVSANDLVRWDGSAWSALGSGTNNTVYAATVFDDGTGPALYAGGAFGVAGGIGASHVARWNGSAWSALGSGVGDASVFNTGVLGFASFDDGSGTKLYACGNFDTAGALSAPKLARWDGSTWTPPGASGNATQGMSGQVSTLAVLDTGNGFGPALYAGGKFGEAGTSIAHGVARWNGSLWSPLGAGMISPGLYDVRALAAFTDGGGTEIYAAGLFESADHQSVQNIARWNGSGWHPLPGGGLNATVDALQVFDDGAGPSLYVAGEFNTAGSTVVNAIARYDGSSWSQVGGGMNAAVSALAVFDDGGGEALYAAGMFTHAGSTNAAHIAKWNGATWSALGSGLDLPVGSLAVFNDGSGNALYAGGAFLHAGSVVAHRIARWNGSAWSPVGLGFDDGIVNSLSAFDDGSGPALYAGGGFTSGEGSSMTGIARWNGSSWSALGSGIRAITTQSIVYALASFDDGTGRGPDLYAGGTFASAGAHASANIAEWRGCASPIDTFCFGDGGVAACPCGNTGLANRGCDNSAATGGAQLVATGTPSPDTLVLHSTGELPSALSIFLQGDALVSASAHFGDGLRCAGGNLKRLFVKNASGGGVIAPGPGDPSISAQSAALGDPIAPGSTRYYQTYYRDSNLAFCPAPQGDSWNLTNGVRVVW